MLTGTAQANSQIWWLSYEESCLSGNTYWSGGQEIPVDAEGNFSTSLDTTWFSNTTPNQILVLSVEPETRDLSTYSGQDGSCFPSEYVTGPIEINYTGALSGYMKQHKYP